MTNPIIEKNCALCQIPFRSRSYVAEERYFCCAGCHAVYQILAHQQALAAPHEHPLFLQAVKSGIISNPDVLEHMRQNREVPETDFVKLHLDIQEMWCPSCAELIRLILLRESGIRNCFVDYATDVAVIEYTPRCISKEKIIRLIRDLGYHPSYLQDARQQAVSFSLYLRFIIAAFFSLNIMMFAYPIYASYFHADEEGYAYVFAWLSLIGSLPVLLYSAWPIWRRFYHGLKVGIWGMEALVFLGVTTASALSLYELWQGRSSVYFDSMTVIIVFVLLGKIIESKAKFSAKDALCQLTRLMPRRGRKLHVDGTEHFVPLKDIQPGDHFVVLTGEKIVLDGWIEAGEGTCDESVMTGESLPIYKKKGDKVLAGTLVQQGRLIIRATAKIEETALNRIIQMVEEDIGHKSHYTRTIDRIVKLFIPCVFVIAFLTACYCLVNQIQDPDLTVFQTAVLRAISILLISCPCAIGIAAPLVESHVLNALAKIGIIIRNRGCLSFLGRETVFVFDKTGTMTEGKLTLLKGLEALSQEEQHCLKGLVKHSNHPIAVALNQALEAASTCFDEVEEIAGKGLRGSYQGNSYLLGSLTFLKEQCIRIPLFEERKGIETTVFFVKNTLCIGVFHLGDQIRSDAQELIHHLDHRTISSMLVSGDLIQPVKEVAQRCGIKQWYAEYHPLQKRELIQKLRQKGEIVAMLGDGINDAPSLTAAHVGIAVVSATDISIQVSDVLLTHDRLSLIVALHQVASKGHRLIKQNLFWAFFYNVIGIGLAIFGFLSPLFAAFAMIISSLIVVLNAQRVR